MWTHTKKGNIIKGRRRKGERGARRDKKKSIAWQKHKHFYGIVRPELDLKREFGMTLKQEKQNGSLFCAAKTWKSSEYIFLDKTTKKLVQRAI